MTTSPDMTASDGTIGGRDVAERRILFRLGGWAAIVGSILGGVGNAIHPVTPENDPVGVARVIADSAAWTVIHVAIVVGIALMLAGLVAIAARTTRALSRVLARLAVLSATVGVTIGLLLVILDGVAARQLAQEWAEAGRGSATALANVHVNETINFPLASRFNLVFAGATIILLGLAHALDGSDRTSSGWIAVAAGLGSIAAGCAQAFIGEPTQVSRVLTIIGPTVITLWVAGYGVALVRDAKRLRATTDADQGHHASPA
jgi:vacuolar-type H+-ATPase subunit I/STV1